MDITVVVGFIMSFAVFIIGVPELKTEFSLYFQPLAFFFVVGGTIASTTISTSFKDLKSVLSVFKQMVFPGKNIEPHLAIKELIKISEKAQTVSKQALAEEGKGIGDGFLHRGMGLIGAGLDREFIEKTLETDIAEVSRRHSKVTTVVRTMGTYAPMFGMTGTVLGVTQVLKNVTDIENIVSGMSLALLTTLYGLILSGVFFIPMANKLKAKTARETLTKEIIMEGILFVYDKEIPLKVEKYLTAFLENKYKNSGKKR